jgi:hypothetical protein
MGSAGRRCRTVEQYADAIIEVVGMEQLQRMRIAAAARRRAQMFSDQRCARTPTKALELCQLWVWLFYKRKRGGSHSCVGLLTLLPCSESGLSLPCAAVLRLSLCTRTGSMCCVRRFQSEFMDCMLGLLPPAPAAPAASS